MAKLAHTSESVIHVGIIMLNLEKCLRLVLFMASLLGNARAWYHHRHACFGLCKLVRLWKYPNLEKSQPRSGRVKIQNGNLDFFRKP